MTEPPKKTVRMGPNPKFRPKSIFWESLFRKISLTPQNDLKVWFIRGVLSPIYASNHLKCQKISKMCVAGVKTPNIGQNLYFKNHWSGKLCWPLKMTAKYDLLGCSMTCTYMRQATGTVRKWQKKCSACLKTPNLGQNLYLKNHWSEKLRWHLKMTTKYDLFGVVLWHVLYIPQATRNVRKSQKGPLLSHESQILVINKL